MNVSLIITTYNWPAALQAVLQSVKQQVSTPFEVLVADDGSTEETARLVKEIAKDFPCPLIHVWQEDQGFQAARIRNKAAARAAGDYLIYIDGDTLIRPDFIQNHCRLANPRFFAAGNRVLLSQVFTDQVLSDQLNVAEWAPGQFDKSQINRPWALHNLPLGPLRRLKKHQWKGAKTCNLGVWRNDLVRVNGFDEAFEGWGYEDSEFAVRLINQNIHHLDCRFAATVLHLWHTENNRSQEKENLKRLHQAIEQKKRAAKKGIDQYL